MIPFLLLLQEPLLAELLREAEGVDIPRAYRAVEKLAAGGAEFRAALEGRASTAKGRLKTHLDAALQGPLGTSRRVTIKAGSRTVIDAVQELARLTGLPLNWDALVDEKLPEIHLEIRDLLPLEALAAICRAAEISALWELGQVILFTGGFVDAPVSRFGPFQLTLATFEWERAVEFVRPPRESIGLGAVLVFEPATPVLDVLGLRILEARDERGGNLLLPPGKEEAEDRPEGDQVARPSSFLGRALALRLKPLSPGARTLAILRGDLTVRIPRVVRNVELVRPGPGSSATGRGLVVRVKAVNPQESRILLDVELLDRTLAGRPLVVTGFAAEGRRERTYARVLESAEDGILRLALEIQPRNDVVRLDREAPVPVMLQLLRVEVAESVDDRSIPFEFRGVTLR